MKDQANVKMIVKFPFFGNFLKSCSGRAGRFKSVYPEGEVTCMDAKDMVLLRQAMTSSVDRVASAGLLPSAEQLEMFAAVTHMELFSELLSRFLEVCRVEKVQNNFLLFPIDL